MFGSTTQSMRIRGSLHLQLLVLVSVVFLLLFAATGSAQAVQIVDQQQTNTSGGWLGFWGGTSSSDNGCAQTFTAGHSGPLNELKVYISGTNKVDFELRADICTTVAGRPSFTPLATGQVSVGRTASGWISIPFISPAMVEAGMQYAIELWALCDYQGTEPMAIWHTGSGDSYATGGCYVEGSGGLAWVGPLGPDCAFQTLCPDTNPPKVTAPADVTVGVPSYMGTTVSFGAASATDDVDGAIPAGSISYFTGYGTADQAEVHSGDVFPVGATTMTATATDRSGNVGTATFTVTVNDTAPQVVDQEQTSDDLQYACDPGSNTLYAQTFTAATNGPLTRASIEIYGYGEPFDVRAQICTVPLAGRPDGSQVLASAVSHVTPDFDPVWLDFTFASPATVSQGTQYALVISFGAPSTWYCGSSSYAGGEACLWGPWLDGDEWLPVAEDFTFKTFTEAPDTTKPTVTPPADVTKDPAGASSAAVTFGAATATDNVDGTIPPSSIHYYTGYDTDARAEVHSGDIFPAGLTTVTAAATDRSGNVGTATFTVLVGTPPVVTPPAGVTVDAPTYLGTAVTFGAASAYDAEDGALPADAIHYYTQYGTASQAEVHSGDTFPAGTTPVTVAATDSNGLTGAATFTITVNDVAPQVVDQEQTGATVWNGWNPRLSAQTFTAGHDGPLRKVSVLLDCTNPSSTVSCTVYSTLDGLPYRPLTTFSGAKPQADGVAHWQDITIASPPVLTAGTKYALVLSYKSDECHWWMAPDGYQGGAAFLTVALPPRWIPFTMNGENGPISYDHAFRTYYESPDTAAPVVDAPADITVDPDDDSGAAVTFPAATATDEADGAIPASSIHYYTGYDSADQAEVHSGDTFPVGTTTVTVAATDRSGNAGTATFSVTVREPVVEVLDQRQEGRFEGLTPPPCEPTSLYAQTFSPGHTGPLTKVSLFITNQYAGAYDAEVLICAWPLTGLPAGDGILARATVSFSGVAEDYWQDVTFAVPPTLTAGVPYAIVVGGSHFSWYINAGSSYLAGWQYTWTGSSWLTKGYRGADYAFRTSCLLERGAPTELALDDSSVDENLPAGADVGDFSTTDADGADGFVYSLATGVGSDNNASFTLSGGGTLKTTASCDHEAKSSYLIRVRSTDSAGLSIENVFTIGVRDINEAPTDITMHKDWVDENQPAGTYVGWFETVDPDGNDESFTCTLVSGPGDTDNGCFTLTEWGELWTADVFDHETKDSYSIRVRSTDVGGFSVEKAFTIRVDNLNEAPLAGSVSFDLGSPRTNDTLTAVPTGFSDPDGAADIDSYTCAWFKNGTAIGGETGSTLDLSKTGNGDKGDVITVSVKAVDKGRLESDAAVSPGVTIVNSAPVLAPIDAMTGPFGDPITFTASATDADGDAITYSLVGFAPGSIDPVTGVYSWTPGPTDIGAHTFVVIAADGTVADGESVQITVTARTATIAACDVQSAAVKSPVKISGSLSDAGGLTSLLANATVKVTLTPVAGGTPITLPSISAAADGRYSASFGTPSPIPVGSYEVCVVVGGSYTGTKPWYDALAVYDPAAGFATGGGWFLWPGTTQKTTFGFVTNYMKNRSNFKGNLVMVRHLPDGTVYRIKSNAVAGLALSSPSRTGGWVSFNGKANYMDPTMSSWLGGYTFNMYAEDNNQPGAGSDKFWIQIINSGTIVAACSMPSASSGSAVPAVTIGGGNITVPHK